MFLRPRNTSVPISTVAFTFNMRRHLIRLAPGPPFVWQSLIRLRLLTSVCNAWQRSRTQILRGYRQKLRSNFSRLWSKVHQILKLCREPLVLSSVLARLSMACFVQKTFATKSRSRRKTEEMQKFFGPQFWSDGRLRLFYVSLLGRLTSYYPLFGKVWLSSDCLSPSAKPGNEAECRIYGGWVKWRSSLNPFVDQSS